MNYNLATFSGITSIYMATTAFFSYTAVPSVANLCDMNYDYELSVKPPTTSKLKKTL